MKNFYYKIIFTLFCLHFSVCAYCQLVFTASHLVEIGEDYNDIGKYDSAILYLEKATQTYSDATLIMGWAHADLGFAYIQKGKSEMAIEEFKKTIHLARTKSSVYFAQYYLDSIKGNLYKTNPTILSHKLLQPKWIKIESKDIVYNFDDTFGISNLIPEYIDKHDSCFESLVSIFQPRQPHKLAFFIWKDTALAAKLLNHNLAFACTSVSIVNVFLYQSYGHEMTHILSEWGWGKLPKSHTRFINEGVAVAFDCDRYNRYNKAKMAISNKNIHSVIEIWQDENTDESILYPVGGAFVTYIYNNSTPEQFESIIKNQTIENFKNVFGNLIAYKMIEDFNSKIGLK